MVCVLKFILKAIVDVAFSKNEIRFYIYIYIFFFFFFLPHVVDTF